MKKTIGFFALVFLFVSCTSDNDMKYKDEDSKTKEVESENPVGIQNVTGNIPDTINTIDISNTNKKDTTTEPGAERIK